jgi:hypothetical protein
VGPARGCNASFEKFVMAKSPVALIAATSIWDAGASELHRIGETRDFGACLSRTPTRFVARAFSGSARGAEALRFCTTQSSSAGRGCSERVLHSRALDAAPADMLSTERLAP